jgi:hypothetical protein
MKIMFAVALATIALPVYAQDQAAPPASPPAATTNGIPNTTLSTSTTPSTGPRAQEGNLPSNNAAAAAGGGQQPAEPPMSTPPAPGQPVVAMASPSPDTALPAPAPLAHYPICKRGQFDKCMEPGNGGGTAHATRHRRHR